MLTKWAVKNFKSFKSLTPIDLSMVNVIAGANSSGKSTLIQSILLLKQTIQYGPEDRPLALNGPILRLGSFKDIKNIFSDESSLEIEFSIEIKESETDNGKPHWGRSTNYSFGNSGQANWNNISLAVAFGVEEESEELFAAHLKDRVQRPELLNTALSVSGSKGEGASTHQFGLVADKNNRMGFDARLDESSIAEVLVGKPAGQITGGFVNYFLPELAVIKYNQTLLDVKTEVSKIIRPRSFLGKLTTADSDEVVTSKVVGLINRWLVQNERPTIETIDGTAPLSVVQQVFEPRRRSLNTLALGINIGDEYDDLEQLKEAIAETLLEERETNWRYAPGHPAAVQYSGTYLIDFFKYGVKYLGPLRDSPRPVYQPEALESTTDVGYRGEHTAAVFEMNKYFHVRYFVPPNRMIEDNYVSSGESRSDTLENATASWLEYLGVAVAVETQDAGVYGNRMRVSVEQEGPLHDLTNVGVGVSQILPIVVMSLLAPEGSLLIFEQPELHLHPKVQARLADFFLALALVGKQTILETHSEYLVDRLRLRIATSELDDVRPLVNILFSERRDGCSSLTPVDISEYGSIINWPADFFEQSRKDVGRIIQAASRKRKLKASKSDD